MIVASCLQLSKESSTDSGNGIGCLQILLGEGGCAKSFVIDSVITTLTSDYSWSKEEYSIYATTGKAATSIGGSTVHNYKDSMGFFGERFVPFSSSTLQAFQVQMKDKKLIIIDEFSMLQKYELAFIDC